MGIIISQLRCLSSVSVDCGGKNANYNLSKSKSELTALGSSTNI